MKKWIALIVVGTTLGLNAGSTTNLTIYTYDADTAGAPAVNGAAISVLASDGFHVTSTAAPHGKAVVNIPVTDTYVWLTVGATGFCSGAENVKVPHNGGQGTGIWVGLHHC